MTDNELKRFTINYIEQKESVYFTGAKFTYNNANMTVQPNELMIAIKE